MSLFKWSTPERRKADQILPIIPNEIYIYIFEYIAPPTGRLTEEELRIFANLSHICRFFANFCLPRIFEFVEFYRSSVYAIPRTSRELTLCTQIAVKEPLALSLVESVRTCHFTNWKLGYAGTCQWYPGMLHMKNIRELRFSSSYVVAEHWNAIAILESLEELSFDSCKFAQGPADVEPEERVKVKVPRLQVINSCDGHCPPIRAIDPQYLRTLAMDSISFDLVDWLSKSTLTELHICVGRMFDVIQQRYLERVPAILRRAPQSAEALLLFVEFNPGFRDMFDKIAWRKLPLLRSLTLRVLRWLPTLPASVDVLSSSLDWIAALTDIQSFTLKSYMDTPELGISLTDVRRILHDRLGSASSLRHVGVLGTAFRLVDGEWSEVSR